MRHTSLGTNAQMMVMMQSFRSSAEKKVEEKWSCGLLRNPIYEGGQVTQKRELVMSNVAELKSNVPN